jgi:hypothetical protein
MEVSGQLHAPKKINTATRIINGEISAAGTAVSVCVCPSLVSTAAK